MNVELGRRDHLTFRGNLRQTRYGWLRLTPAYSVHQVEDLLDSLQGEVRVLDPFCGTGTTALVCAERGIACDTTDINPFLVWLATAKTQAYSSADVDAFLSISRDITETMRASSKQEPWIPALHQIEKWWDPSTLKVLGRALAKITRIEETVSTRISDLLKVAFCRTIIEHAHVSFAHQSMSFRKHKSFSHSAPLLPGFDQHPVATTWDITVPMLASAARRAIVMEPRVLLSDARTLDGAMRDTYSLVITSPPYPNRMSYIRELRPYMYWLGYLEGGRAAGELDWKAIGGTWGCATSNLSKWQPNSDANIPYHRFSTLLTQIANRSAILSRYIHRYFEDMAEHCQSLFTVVREGGNVQYVVGNSKFYDTLLPVEEIFASLFEAAGFEAVVVQPTRKRSSKKELYEFIVSGRRPLGRR